MTEIKEYCECGIYMSNGQGVCLMCGNELKPIKIRDNKNDRS